MFRSCIGRFAALAGAGAVAGLSISLRLAAPLGLVTAIAALWLLQRAVSWRGSAWGVFAFACGFMAGGMFWIGQGVYRPPVNSLGDAVALCGVLLLFHAAIYTVVIAALHGAATLAGWRSRAALCCCLVVGWPLAEVLRSSGFWAMPWGLLGYGQIDNPVLLGLFPLIGVYGVAGATWALAAGLLASARALRTGLAGFGRRHLAGLLACVAATSSQGIEWTSPMQPLQPALTVRLIHTHWPDLQKHTPATQAAALAELLEVARHGGADLAVFPELFLVQSASEIPKPVRDNIIAAARASSMSLLLGSAGTVAADGGPARQQNLMLQIDAAGATRSYAKEVLLPFSEYLPAHPALNWAYPYLFHYPMADLIAGPPGPHLLQVRGVALGPTICNELAYAGKASQQARDAGLLVNISSDSWIPSLFYMAQAQQIARVRAAEAQKPLVRANNVGYSAFIDARGRVRSDLIGVAGAGTLDVEPRVGVTPFVAVAAWVAGFAD